MHQRAQIHGQHAHDGGRAQAVKNFSFTPNTITVAAGTAVIFDFQQGTHTVKTVSVTNATAITINNGGGDLDAIPVGQQKTVIINGRPGGQINYECGIHGAAMTGVINIA